MEIISIIINILLSVSFVATFICIFFITYAKKVEEDVVLKNVEYIIDNTVGSMTSLIPEPIKLLLRYKLSAQRPKDMTKEDNDVEKKNNELIAYALQVIALCLTAVIILTYFMASTYKLDYSKFIVQNLIIVAVLGYVEYLFLNYAGRNFISADMNVIKTSLLDMISD